MTSPARLDVSEAASVVHDQRISRRASRYGVTAGALYLAWVGQGRACAICRQAGELSDLVVDHNHLTGEVRGMVCARCNPALGLLGDNPTIVDRAAGYLRTKGFEAHRALPATPAQGRSSVEMREYIEAAARRPSSSVLASEHRRVHRFRSMLGEVDPCPVCVSASGGSADGPA